MNATEEESFGHLVHHIRGQDCNENAGGQCENVPAVVANVQVLRQQRLTC